MIYDIILNMEKTGIKPRIKLSQYDKTLPQIRATVYSNKGVAGKVKDFLGFSEPDEGPLSNFHTYAPDMIDLFVKGIKDNQKKLDKAITDAFDFKPMIEGGMDIGLANPNSKYVDRNEGVTINVYAAKNQNVNELADIIGRKLNNEIRRNQEVWA